MTAGAFDGIRILDFTQGLAGPLGCALLADLGAQVIKIEPPEGDRLREHPGYLCWNRNKRRLTLDLDAEDDREAARALIDGADVTVFDGTLERLERLGLDGASLRTDRPDLLWVHLPHWGARGWWDRLPVDDVLLWGMSGGAFAQFSWEDVPVQLVSPQLGYGHAMISAAAIAAAIYERGRSGAGQSVTVSGLHAHAAVGAGARPPVVPAGRAKGARGTAPNYKLYECGDGRWIFLATLLLPHFRSAIEAMGLMDIMEMAGVDGKIANVLRRGVGGRVRDRLVKRFTEKDRAQWLRILRAAGVPCGPAGSRQQWFDSETVTANEMRVELEHPELGPVQITGVPAKLHDTPGRVHGLMRDADLDGLLAEANRRGRPVQREPAPELAGPLAGVRVLDLGVIIAAPFASAVLANFGADVIKVEPLAGDSFRPYGLGFVTYNQGKRSVALDLKQPRGLSAFHELVRNADVVCHNFRLGVLERLGIDHDSLREINPRIISASVTAYGPEGPFAPDPGFDPLLQAQSGLMSAQGGDDEPVFHSMPVNDIATAMVSAFAIAAALHARERTGRGQLVETCLANQSVLCQSGELVRHADRKPGPVGGRDCLGLDALHRFYACEDGEWLGLSCSGADAVARLFACLGLADLGRDRGFERAQQEAWDGALAAALSDAFAKRSRDTALALLAEAEVPAAPVTRANDTMECELHVANRVHREFQHPRFGVVHGPRGYAEFSRTPGGFARGAPLLGEHSAEVLSEAGVDAERLEELVRNAVVGVG